MTVGAIAGGYMAYQSSGGSMSKTFFGALSGACAGAGFGFSGLARGAGMLARGAVNMAKQSAWRSIGTDSAIGAVSSFSGTKATGGSNADAFKNAGFGALGGAITGRFGKPKTFGGQMLKTGGIGGLSNSITQVVEIGLSDDKTLKDMNGASVVGSTLGGMAAGALSFNVPAGIMMDVVSAPRGAMVETSVSALVERSFR